MEFRNYKLQFIIRIAILVLGLLALVYSVFILHNFIRSLFSIFYCIISIAEFYYFLNKMNRDFKSFLQALIYEDFSNYYNKKNDSTGVYNLFNQLNEKYRKIGFDKEVQHSFIQTIIEHISVGIVVINENKEIVLLNNNLLQLFKIRKIETLDELIAKYPLLKEKVINLKPGKPDLVELIVDGELIRLSMNISKFKLEGINYDLISIQDINVELDEQELIAWQKLIRVLTHEIMNSVTPISSLSSSLNTLLTRNIKDNYLDQKNLDYLISGLNAVQDRSESLLKFTESYKKLTQIQHPDYSKINVSTLFETVLMLHKTEINRLGINAKYSFDEDLELLADKLMIEQVIINLVKNAIEILENMKNPALELKCFKENEYITIQVIDNGIGIPDDKIDKIFIPFFTTKEKGSGIGLSFARQVMRLHKGNVFVKSIPGKTIFTLKF
jgi:nitrogen fixation/metabolism regulation signal transduction histidine kinase